jgi:hypothetical protein
MTYEGIEEHLSVEYGVDQYKAYDRDTKNREEIMSSEICGCFFCQANYDPSSIRKWKNIEQAACCPECRLGNVVVGSASVLPVHNKEFLRLVGAHWC